MLLEKALLLNHAYRFRLLILRLEVVRQRRAVLLEELFR